MEMKPLPWSPTALDDFKNCPRAYHAKYVLKRFKDVKPTKEMEWGRWVHEQFENRLAVNTPLPVELRDHEPYLAKLAALPGVLFTEQKIALSKDLTPCHSFDRSVWFRAVSDVTVVENPRAKVVDYKTGKRHTKPHQLALIALHTFAAYPDVQEVKSEFYWTKDPAHPTTNVYLRDDIPAMWGLFVPDLRQYKEAFNADLWQPRPSGLCNGWCLVTDCEHWKPRRIG